MVNNNASVNSYNYGNTAVEFKPEVKRVVTKQPKRKKSAKNESKLKLKMVAVVGVVCIFSFLTLLRFASIINIQGNIRLMKEEIVKIQKDNENIRVDIAKQNNLKKIEEAAVHKYSMATPEINQILYVDVKPLAILQEEDKTTALQFVQRLLGLIY
jgi:cell division protein FtsL